MKRSVKIAFEVEKDNKLFQFLVPEGSSMGNALDALMQCWKQLSEENANSLKKNEEALEMAKKKKEETGEK